MTKDPDFKGSLFEQLGFSDELCTKCGANLKNGICLNGCHLPPRTLAKFQTIMKGIIEEQKRDRNDDA